MQLSDPNNYVGIDTVGSTFQKAHALFDAGVRVVFKYSENTHSFPEKTFDRDMVMGLATMNIRRGYLWERYDTAAEFAEGHAEVYARLAIGKMEADGTRPGTLCVHCVDFDASDLELNDLIVPHFAKIHALMSSAGYLVGVYGSGKVCERVKGLGYAHCSYVAQSTGWDGTKDYKDWDIKQHESGTLCGLDVDWIEVKPSVLAFLA